MERNLSSATRLIPSLWEPAATLDAWVAVLGVAFSVWGFRFIQRRKSDASRKEQEVTVALSDISELATVTHDLKRKQNLAFGRITDNAGRIAATLNNEFDLTKTIFKTLPQRGVKALFQRSKIDMHYTWDGAVVNEIEKAYSAVPKPVSDDTPIYKFMLEECDFAMEHADGSFMDHLHFCREYAALHYKKATSSPRVLLLHSICGVGTNCFPMTLEKLPTLRSLLSAEDMTHIEAFPSILRLLVHGPLLQELQASDAATLGRLRSIKFHRLLDNTPIELDAMQLWEQLNYQLIHAIDFLPPASWKRTSSGSYFFHIFVELHTLLSRIHELQAEVGWDAQWMRPYEAGCTPPTWRHYLLDFLPCPLVLRLASKAIAGYSADVGHSLAYSLTWAEQSR